MLRRSQLYVPGNNERMIGKANSLDADSIILDLEDAVPMEQKSTARRLVRQMADGLDWGKRELCVRVNSPATVQGRADLTLSSSLARVDSLVIPKAEGSLSSIHKKTGKNLIPIIETAKGLQLIEPVVRSEGVVAVTHGVADLALSVGGSVSGYLDNPYVKTRVVIAARAYGLDPVDSVFFDLKDQRGFRSQAVQARSLGFSGKQVIHPSQVSVANEVFSPTEEELSWAREVVKGYRKLSRKGKGAFALEGGLVDEVHYRLAVRMLEGSRPRIPRD